MKYLIIGDGRVARHFKHYFELESLPFSTWSRKASTAPSSAELSKARLKQLSEDASHVLVLISDQSIPAFLEEHPELQSKTLVHFSGIVTTPLAVGAHPLMTFAANTLYSLETYRTIPFVIEEGRASFEKLLPGLRNPSYSIPAEKKPLYHALCAMSGNFTTLLWEKVCREFSGTLGLPKSVLLPYMRRTVENLVESSSEESVLTGPLARGDQRAIEIHLQALSHDPYREVYEAFARAYLTESSSTGGSR